MMGAAYCARYKSAKLGVLNCHEFVTRGLLLIHVSTDPNGWNHYIAFTTTNKYVIKKQSDVEISPTAIIL